MKRKNGLGKSISFLAVGILAALAFVRGPAQIWAFAGVFAVWAIWAAAIALKANGVRIKARFARRRKWKTGGTEEPDQIEDGIPGIDTAMETKLLHHVNCRISAYLQSAYPGVTWEWCAEDPAKLAVEGGTGRIKLDGVPDYNYANVTLDGFDRIGCEMMKIVPLAAIGKAGGSAPAKAGYGQAVDPQVWYDFQGKKTLERCVGDLHSHGHSSLLIRETGELCFTQSGSEVIHDRFSSFPGKSVWDALANVIQSHGLSASVTGDGIVVSW